MPNAKSSEGQTIITLEKFEKALLWKIDELREVTGMNRTSTLQHVLWLGLQHMGMTKGSVREAYDKSSGGNR